jgi:ABC-2 type transport system ATP-binding protein
MEEAQELSDRIGIIDHGKLIALGTLDELTQMVGEHEMLQLQLYQSEGGQTLADAVAAFDGVHQASADDGAVVLNVDSAEATLPKVLSKAGALDLSVRNIEIREPNLETVFLHLTGRALRD